VPDEAEQGQVVDRVRVGPTLREVEPLLRRQRPDGGRLRLAVQHGAHETPGVDAVDGLGDGSEGAGETQPVGDDGRQFDGGGGDEPDAPPVLEVALCQRCRARPDAVGHLLVVDLLAECDDVGDPLAGHEGEGRFAAALQVGRVLAAQPQPHLARGEADEVTPGEQVAGGHAPREVVDRRADHDRVVDVEEGGRRSGQRVLGGRDGIAVGGQHRASLGGPDHQTGVRR
jgi:hypothetical protein